MFGALLGRIRLHRVERFSIKGVEWIHKRRRLSATWLIPPGNLYLRLAGNPSIVLSRARWLAWERAVDVATGRHLLADSPENDSSGLWCRLVPGLSLQQLLADDAVALELKLEALGWSLVALRVLHACVADWGDGRRQTLSHGDATAGNVIVDLATRSACWIDFETRHRPRYSEVERRADDVRALIDSAVVYLPATCFPQLGETLAATLDDESLRTHLSERFRGTWRDFTVAQLAQAPLSWGTAMALRASLSEALDRNAGRVRLE
ncbi:MAG TPA: hypothetical protein VHB77_08215 [Planctomycetaceae bacterium]|nr:hypothetical protein [Planctomycetaceae bacterium]